MITTTNGSKTKQCVPHAPYCRCVELFVLDALSDCFTELKFSSQFILKLKQMEVHHDLSDNFRVVNEFLPISTGDSNWIIHVCGPQTRCESTQRSPGEDGITCRIMSAFVKPAEWLSTLMPLPPVSLYKSAGMFQTLWLVVFAVFWCCWLTTYPFVFWSTFQQIYSNLLGL